MTKKPRQDETTLTDADPLAALVNKLVALAAEGDVEAMDAEIDARLAEYFTVSPPRAKA
jgi:hypothetical protein